VSVDFVVSVRDPVALAAVIETTSHTLGALLAIGAVPRLTVIDGREYRRGVQTDLGRVLLDVALSAMTIGDPIPPNRAGRVAVVWKPFLRGALFAAAGAPVPRTAPITNGRRRPDAGPVTGRVFDRPAG
jgi:hypothetical protein